ncbi:MAG: arsenite methyltransferase [candidate division NC10 bacterium]|nr:arsenite methyltransferase [candidate division NC10 bacterium]
MGYTTEEIEMVPEGAIATGAGCGNPTALADLREGEVVLDLGSGGGIDVLLAARKVGPKGRVIGIDMTEEMIQRARENAKAMGLDNVEFRIGEIENLPVENESIDVVISNCVINLSPDKGRVFQEAFRVLRPGGRVVVSDIVSKGKLPEEARKDMDAWARCIAGALEDREYLEKIRKAGFQSLQVVSKGSHREPGKVYSINIKAIKPMQKS